MNKPKFVYSLAVAALLLLSACIKNHEGPVKCQPVDPAPPCNSTITGMVEGCPMQPEVWFINISPVQITLNATNKELLAPINLPDKYKVEGMMVTIRYDRLSDSLMVTCGCFPVAPFDYAAKIRICEVEEIKN